METSLISLPLNLHIKEKVRLDQESANDFCKEPGHKYFRLCRPVKSVKTFYICYCGGRAARDNRNNDHDGARTKCCYWTLRFEFYIIFMSHKISFSPSPPAPLKNIS